jgi:hypothetical protein
MLLLSQILTSLEKQQVLDQAVKAGDNYHLDKCGLAGLSQAGLLQKEEEEEGEERQKHCILKREIRQYLSMTLSDLKMTRMNGAVIISSNAFLRV